MEQTVWVNAHQLQQLLKFPEAARRWARMQGLQQRGTCLSAQPTTSKGYFTSIVYTPWMDSSQTNSLRQPSMWATGIVEPSVAPEAAEWPQELVAEGSRNLSRFPGPKFGDPLQAPSPALYSHIQSAVAALAAFQSAGKRRSVLSQLPDTTMFISSTTKTSFTGPSC